MQTSARNQFHGIVERITKGQVNAEVVLRLASGDALTAQVTLESLKSLDLAEGKKAWALVKAQWVMLAPGSEVLKVSARNCMRGPVAKVVPGAVNTEVSIGLSGGVTITSVITKESAEHLGFKVGDQAWAFFKAGSVILAVEG